VLVQPGGTESLECPRDECVNACVFAVSIRLDQLESRQPMGWVRWSEILATVSCGQRGCADP